PRANRPQMECVKRGGDCMLSLPGKDKPIATTTALPTPTMRRRSASQLMSYSSCSEMYRLQRIARAPQRPAAWLFQGTAVHAAIELFEESRRKASIEELEDAFIMSYREAANDAIEKQDGHLDAFMTGGRKKPETDLSD